MKRNKYCLIIITFLFIMLFPSIVKADTEYTINENALVKRSCTFKTRPNEAGDWAAAGVAQWFDPGDKVTAVDNVEPVTSTNVACKTKYYNVIYGGKDGWVCGDFINFSQTGKYYEELKKAGFPDDYLASLNVLKEMYPNWNFVAYKTGLTWSTVIEKESIVGKSYINVKDPNGADAAYLSLDGGSYDPVTKKFIQKESGGWYAANKYTVAYYMDPRNFLNANNIFMFENNYLDKSYQTEEAVKSVFGTTKLLQYSDLYVKAADFDTSNISPTFLAARSRLEVVVGSDLSNAANGNSGYYNFFNIGAYSSCINPVTCGNIVAGNKGWITPELAIKGGANWIYTNYVNVGQKTLYLQKFNVTTKSTYSHQYMTNVEAPKSEAALLYSGYNGEGLLNKAITFYIPIYEKMPQKVSLLPTAVNPEDKEEAEQGGETTPNTLSVSSIVNGASYRYESGYVSKINPKTKASAVISKLKSMSSSATITITKKSTGKTISGSEYLSTSDTIKITNNNKTETLSVIIYGDTSGDGAITALDLLKTQKHILGSSKLSGAFLKAADTNKDGKVTALDLLTAQKHILGSKSISQ